MRLASFPSGQSLFIDANCLVYHFLGTHPQCTAILHRAEIRDIAAFTSVVVVAELRHRLMILEASDRLRLPPRKVLAFLKRHPGRIRSLHACVKAVDSLSALQVASLPLTAEIILASQQISGDYGLLTNDALIVATMRAHRLTHLASNDADFTHVPTISLWRP